METRRSEMGPLLAHHPGIVESRRRGGKSEEGNNAGGTGFTESEFRLITIIMIVPIITIIIYFVDYH